MAPYSCSKKGHSYHSHDIILFKQLGNKTLEKQYLVALGEPSVLFFNYFFLLLLFDIIIKKHSKAINADMPYLHFKALLLKFNIMRVLQLCRKEEEQTYSCYRQNDDNIYQTQLSFLWIASKNENILTFRITFSFTNMILHSIWIVYRQEGHSHCSILVIVKTVMKQDILF